MSSTEFTCPHCSKSLQLPEDVWYYTCDFCGARLDLKAQFAFLRGLEAFEEGQTLMVSKGPRRQYQKTRNNPVYRQVLDLFIEAYSSLQVAFTAELGPLQRQVGVEMMTSMSSEFFRQNMISPFEMSYWGSVMTEQSAQVEHDELKAKIQALNGPFAFLARLRWQIRINQLERKLPEVAARLARLEEQIGFVERIHARNLKWKA
jgi:hypothetical protein